MSQAQYLNGYDDGYADAVKKIKASAGQGGGSEPKVINMPAPGGTVIDISTIPSAGMYVVADFEMGDGITFTGWEDPNETYKVSKASGPTIFYLIFDGDHNCVRYALYTLNDASIAGPK